MKYQGIVVEQPTMSFTSTGKAVTNVRVDTNKEQLLVVFWEDLAEKIAHGVRVHDRVELYGTKRKRWWTDQEGEKHSRDEVNAHRLKVIARQLIPKYCCLSCCHFETDCIAGCYNALDGTAYQESCAIQDNICITNDSHDILMNRDCWEK